VVDCLVDLVLRPGEHGLAPVQAQLTVIATISTLSGGDDEPGEVNGDLVPAETVRRLAESLGLLPPAEAPPTTPDPPTRQRRRSSAHLGGNASLDALLGTRNIAAPHWRIGRTSRSSTS
jgi:hypothetical protein